MPPWPRPAFMTPVRGTVLDPFGGAGTTGLVADRLQRDAILIELNPEYAALAEARIHDARARDGAGSVRWSWDHRPSCRSPPARRHPDRIKPGICRPGRGPHSWRPCAGRCWIRSVELGPQA